MPERPARPGQGGSGIQKPVQPIVPERPTRPGQGGGGIQKPIQPIAPDRPNRPGQGGGDIQKPIRPIDPDRPVRPVDPLRPNRPDRPNNIVNAPNANIGNRQINNNVNNINLNQWNHYSQNNFANVQRPWYGGAGYYNRPFYGGMPASYWSRPWSNYHYGWHSGYWNIFSSLPAFWLGYGTGAALATPTFVYANPYYAAPPQSTTVIVQSPDYSQPIPPPTVEQTVIAYPPAPDPEKIAAGEALPTTAPPAPPEDETANAAEKIFGEAREAFKAGKYVDAEKLGDKAIEKLPSDATLHEFRSLALFAQGKYKDAAAGLYAVLAAGPGWNWETMQSMYADPAVYTKQLRALEAAGTEKNGAIHFLLAYHYLVLNNKDAAIQELKYAVEYQPDDKLSAELLKALQTPAPPDPGK